uniref:NADH dehydrogenase subunit 2 n=1 Tax=Dermacentor reticulatus TaxID=57047 RepID=UPI00226CAA57|nr:NADH dehydrogenase subunit 2 [Dermacentor reticulatus]UZG91442.1 NADH dehydrogenase subunit 2 [Dermacentor reticulatus]UZG91455.1 NADH dehydrogenase subunit 2 [Dermacentor reticulatus]UZG91468.1 NADH dehydrogenase subunit 2 [Dermacentor reticulatus]UZG91481.1 NADH dehydrogenase subunit 2 [Dermacentor reticulatus]UZG91494.1 NADH dehydrogenase subunit 2 [Dermacentor reticulatus]
MFFKKLMVWMIIMTILISISSNSWFIYWLSMEMNLMSFIPILNNYKIKNCNSMIIYFVIQSFSSSLFFISSFQFNLSNSIFFLSLLNISILIKLAIFPFHFWLMSISESLNFNALFLILSFQKVIPLFILSNFFFHWIIIQVMISTLISSIMALNFKLVKKLLILSSISHQGWMISMIFKKINFWILYLITYSIIIYTITILCEKFNLISLINISNKKINYSNKMNLISQFMSLGGMPPFLGFFIKIMAICSLMKFNLFIIVILIISSLINLFFYFKILTPIFFFNVKSLKNSNFTFNKKTLFINMNFMLLIFFINLWTY